MKKEKTQYKGWSARVMAKIAPAIEVKPAKKGNMFAPRSNRYKI